MIAMAQSGTPDLADECRSCGRPLRDLVSRAAGIGPVCAAAHHLPRGRRPASPDQLTLEAPVTDQPLCGARFDSQPASTCTEPLGHAEKWHSGSLIDSNGRHFGGGTWGEERALPAIRTADPDVPGVAVAAHTLAVTAAEAGVPHGRCGNDPRTVLSPGDAQVVAEAKEYLAARKERRERYAAAITKASGWVLDDGQHMIDAVMAVAHQEQRPLLKAVADLTVDIGYARHELARAVLGQEQATQDMGLRHIVDAAVGEHRSELAAAARLRTEMDQARSATAPVYVWQVWAEDESIHGLYATEEDARQGSIDYWQETEPSCPDYSWAQDGPRLELVVGGERGGVYISRQTVLGHSYVSARGAALRDAIAAVEDPAQRALTTIGLGLGWESARDVLRRMAAEAQPPAAEGEVTR